MKQEMKMMSGDLPENYVLLFERIVTLEGQLAKQQFYGDPEEGCENMFAMKYEIIEQEKTVFDLLKELHEVMAEAKESLVKREKYEDAGDLQQLLNVIQQVTKSRRN